MPDESQPAPPKKASRRRRLALRLGVAVAAALFLFVLLVFVLPTPLARYVIDAQLEKLGIQHDGIETVRVDLWNSRVRAGPVGFRSGEAREGQIGETGFDYSFAALVKGRAFVQIFYLRGVDLRVDRKQDGTIEINGVNLQRIQASREDTAAAKAPPEEGKESGFEVGVERFEFTDSELVFEDLTGGSVTIDLERLTLERLRSWSPDEPTAFTLEGRVNEMHLSLDGTVLPLHEPLRVTLDSRIKDITIDRVARFVGPTGLERQGGSVDTEVRYDYSIYEDGRIEGTVDGTYDFADFEIATAAGETATLGKAVLQVDLEQKRRADGSVSAAGRLRLEAAPVSFSVAAGDSLELGSLELVLGDLDFEKGTEQRRRVLEWGFSPSEAEEGSATAPSIIDLMVGWARELGRNALMHVLEIDGRPSLTLNNGLLRQAARGEVPGREIRFEKLTLDLGDVASEAFDAGWRVSAGLEAAIAGLRLAAEGGGSQVDVPQLRVDSRTIEASVTEPATTLAFDLSAALRDVTAEDVREGSLSLRRLSLASEGLSIKQTAESGEATGPLVLDLEGLAANLLSAEGAMTVHGETLELVLSPFSLVGKETLAATFGGTLEGLGLSLERAAPSPLSLTLASARTAVEELQVAPLDAQATITGGFSTILSAIALEGGEGEDAFSLSLDSLENQVQRLRASGFDNAEPGVSLANRIKLTGLKGSLAIGGGHRATAAVASLEAPLSELALTAKAARAAGALEATGLSVRTVGEPPQSLNIASVSVTGLTGNSEGGAAIESIALGELMATLTLPRRGLPEERDSDPGATVGAGDKSSAANTETRGLRPPEEPIKVGDFSIAPGSRIEITDSSVKPPLRASIRLDDLRLGPVDTGAPAARTNLALATLINKTTKATLKGWASPFKQSPDFNLTSQVESLSLPPLSPYAAAAVGVNIESGALSADAEASATDGGLMGAVDLRIDKLFVTPVSEQEAAELKSSIGVPVGFAIGILKDSAGVIEFRLPLSGTLESPEVDYSEAISKAIGGALASMFPTSWFGPDGNTFEMQPATFIPGTTLLTEEGKAVADEMGALIAEKSGIRVRACGRAARADLLVLRANTAEVPIASEVPLSSAATTPAATVSGEPPAPVQPPAQEISEPTEREVEALLALATERGTAVRQYLEENYGIEPTRVPECRTAYSLKAGKSPRAEFQL